MDENLLRELNEKNVGFSFLWNQDEAQSSAMVKLQWCIAPQLLEYLKSVGAMHFQVFITVFNPQWTQQTRFVADLDSPQELIEFHHPGKHEIQAQVIWTKGIRRKRAAVRNFLDKKGRHSYENSAHEVFHNLKHRGGGTVGHAQLSVDVADGFFAPKLSPSQDWWVNLWHGEPAWDECELRRRKWAAYTVQVPVVALWALWLFLVRFAVAFWLTVICARSEVRWSVLVHPFSDYTLELWESSRKRDLSHFERLLVPLNQMKILAAAGVFVFIGGAMNNRLPLASTAGATYVALLFLVLFFPFLTAIGGNASTRLNEWAARRAGEIGDVAAIARKVQAEEEARIAKSGQRLERLCADLVCTTAPVDRSLRTQRQGFSRNLVLRYHDLKARVCRPIARN